VARNVSIEPEVGYRRNEFAALSTSANMLFELPRLGRITLDAATDTGKDGGCETGRRFVLERDDRRNTK
jgi:hypothetical protein